MNEPRMVFCKKLGKEAPGLPFKPFTDDFGQLVYDNVSMEAWQMWLGQQTILINEHRISPIDPEARKFLETEMEKFFFGGGSDMPGGFVMPTKPDK